jgi:hypothetical protein
MPDAKKWEIRDLYMQKGLSKRGVNPKTSFCQLPIGRGQIVRALFSGSTA